MDASLFTIDTTTLFDYNITDDVLNSDIIPESKSKITQPMGIHSQSKHKYIKVFGVSNIQYHDFNNGDALTFKDKYTTLLQQELQNPYWCLCHASARLPASQSTAPHFPFSLDGIRNRKAQTGLIHQSSLIELHPQNRTQPNFWCVKPQPIRGFPTIEPITF